MILLYDGGIIETVVPNNQDQSRYTARINQDFEVFIYAVGETKDSTLLN